MQVAEPLELYNRPENMFVAGFIGSPPMNFFRGALRAAGGRVSFVEDNPAGPPLTIALDETLASSQASLNGPDYARTTYRAKGANWFVVSGYRDIGGVDSVFYEKYIFARGDVIDSLIVTYPSALKGQYDPIAAKVAASFAGGD